MKRCEEARLRRGMGGGVLHSRRGIRLQRGAPQAENLKIRSSFSVLPLLRDKVEMGFRDNLPLVSDTQNCVSRQFDHCVYREVSIRNLSQYHTIM